MRKHVQGGKSLHTLSGEELLSRTANMKLASAALGAWETDILGMLASAM